MLNYPMEYMQVNFITIYIYAVVSLELASYTLTVLKYKHRLFSNIYTPVYTKIKVKFEATVRRD